MHPFFHANIPEEEKPTPIVQHLLYLSPHPTYPKNVSSSPILTSKNEITLSFWFSDLVLIHVLQPNTNRPTVRLELLDLGELHDGTADVAQALGAEVRASYVLGEGAEVDAGILLGVPVGCWAKVSIVRKLSSIKEGRGIVIGKKRKEEENRNDLRKE